MRIRIIGQNHFKTYIRQSLPSNKPCGKETTNLLSRVILSDEDNAVRTKKTQMNEAFKRQEADTLPVSSSPRAAREMGLKLGRGRLNDGATMM